VLAITGVVKTNMKIGEGKLRKCFSKKLNYFAESLLDLIFEFDLSDKKKLYLSVYRNIFKFGAHYLRLDSLQVLKTMIESDMLSKLNMEDIESIIL
jgi:hypothetical protein